MVTIIERQKRNLKTYPCAHPESAAGRRPPRTSPNIGLVWGQWHSRRTRTTRLHNKRWRVSQRHSGVCQLFSSSLCRSSCKSTRFRCSRDSHRSKCASIYRPYAEPSSFFAASSGGPRVVELRPVVQIDAAVYGIHGRLRSVRP